MGDDKYFAVVFIFLADAVISSLSNLFQSKLGEK